MVVEDDRDAGAAGGAFLGALQDRCHVFVRLAQEVLRACAADAALLPLLHPLCEIGELRHAARDAQHGVRLVHLLRSRVRLVAPALGHLGRVLPGEVRLGAGCGPLEPGQKALAVVPRLLCAGALGRRGLGCRWLGAAQPKPLIPGEQRFPVQQPEAGTLAQQEPLAVRLEEGSQQPLHLHRRQHNDPPLPQKQVPALVLHDAAHGAVRPGQDEHGDPHAQRVEQDDAPLGQLRLPLCLLGRLVGVVVLVVPDVVDGGDEALVDKGHGGLAVPHLRCLGLCNHCGALRALQPAPQVLCARVADVDDVGAGVRGVGVVGAEHQRAPVARKVLALHHDDVLYELLEAGRLAAVHLEADVHREVEAVIRPVGDDLAHLPEQRAAVGAVRARFLRLQRASLRRGPLVDGGATALDIGSAEAPREAAGAGGDIVQREGAQRVLGGSSRGLTRRAVRGRRARGRQCHRLLARHLQHHLPFAAPLQLLLDLLIKRPRPHGPGGPLVCRRSVTGLDVVAHLAVLLPTTNGDPASVAGVAVATGRGTSSTPTVGA
mmetsp:Transcript_4019/g.10329  ORF Transcript_4019/g.10329 Transcript_4019/m.10329 type:complete len:546 (+) Transcript_4019:1031-2668(+)